MPDASLMAERIRTICSEVLEALDCVSKAAQPLDEVDPSQALDLPQNTFTQPSAAQLSLAKILHDNRVSRNFVRGEPFVTRVVAEREDGTRRTYYFCRGVPPTVDDLKGRLSGYYSPIGVLAEHAPGDEAEVEVEDRTLNYSIVERVQLRPVIEQLTWDAIENVLETSELKRALRSMRAYLEELAPGDAQAFDDLFAEIEKEEKALEQAEADREGIRREARRTLSLRDQATLDRYQGRVFRLPLAQRIFLDGPPGTGKTTTLIKRVAQKLDASCWDERELERLLEQKRLPSWVMFTPTDLLKLYLKEAFAKEHVGAPENCVKTWESDRRRLGRDVLGILRTQRSGQFRLGPDALLASETSPAVWRAFEAFDRFHRDELVARFREEFAFIRDSEASDELKELTESVRRRVGGENLSYEQLFDVVVRQSEFAKHQESLSREVAQTTQEMARSMLGRTPGLIDEIVDQIREPATAGGRAGEGQDEDEDEDDEGSADVGQAASPRRKALNALLGALSSIARASARGQMPGPRSKYASLIELLGDRLPASEELAALGRLRRLRTAVTFLSDSHKSLIESTPAAFQRFRRRAPESREFYRPDVRELVSRNQISAPELDIVILAMLRAARRLTSRPNRIPQGTPLAIVDAVLGEYRTQVLVDEATDFSSVELACMHALTDPLFSSLFAAGDVRQRMTSQGIRSLDELRAVAHDVEVHSISVGYRQSPSLIAFTQALSTLIPGDPVDVEPFYAAEVGDVPPLLKENVAPLADHASWVGERVLEIERTLGEVPAIAVFVRSDADVLPFAEALGSCLDGHHIMVRACPGGRDVGHDNELRVFAAEYIKGLEFEAVFFAGIDRVAEALPDLFAQILYVGATRATRYLALTCERGLPPLLDPVRDHFTSEHW